MLRKAVIDPCLIEPAEIHRLTSLSFVAAVGSLLVAHRGSNSILRQTATTRTGRDHARCRAARRDSLGRAERSRADIADRAGRGPARADRVRAGLRQLRAALRPPLPLRRLGMSCSVSVGACRVARVLVCRSSSPCAMLFFV